MKLLLLTASLAALIGCGVVSQDLNAQRATENQLQVVVQPPTPTEDSRLPGAAIVSHECDALFENSDKCDELSEFAVPDGYVQADASEENTPRPAQRSINQRCIKLFGKTADTLDSCKEFSEFVFTRIEATPF